jgi:hypothetical protein
MGRVPLEARPLAVHDITSGEVGRRIGQQMRKMIGPGRRWSYRGVALLTGIDMRTLRAYAAGTACPNMAKYKRLLVVLGPELARDVDRMYGWMPRAEPSPPGTLDLVALRADLVARLALIDRLLAEAQERRR